MGRFGDGTVKNYSSKPLWVVAEGVAHKLQPKRRSPGGVDADGAKAVDGTPIDGHRSWWKVPDLGTLSVKDDGRGGLTSDCAMGVCWRVEEDEFGSLRYDDTDGWGDAM
jgi:hypothetical protein